MSTRTFKATALSAFIVLSAAALACGAVAAGSHSGGHGDKKGHGEKMGHGAEKGHGHGSAMAIGEPGDAAKVGRTIPIIMNDNYYEPEEIKVKEGETIRFVVINNGEFLHEFNIGTAAMHATHQKEMAMMAEHGMITATSVDHAKMKMDHGDGKAMMAHDDPNSVLLEPGKKSEVIWKFTKVMDLEFACNVPGHYDAGMMGPIHIGHGH
jgi:uncharacterized cupredoxin-like copper-binding protein